MAEMDARREEVALIDALSCFDELDGVMVGGELKLSRRKSLASVGALILWGHSILLME